MYYIIKNIGTEYGCLCVCVRYGVFSTLQTKHQFIISSHIQQYGKRDKDKKERINQKQRA